MTIDDDGTALYSTGLGHGDALHVSDLDPGRPGPRGVRGARGGAAQQGHRGDVPRRQDRRGALVDAGHRRHRPRRLGRHRRLAPRLGVVGRRHRRHVELAVGGDAGGRRHADQHHHPRGELPHLVGRRPPAGDHRPRLGHDGAHGRPDDRQVEPVDRRPPTRSTGRPAPSPTTAPRAPPPCRPTCSATGARRSSPAWPTRRPCGSPRRWTSPTTGCAPCSPTRCTASGVAWQNTGYNQPPHTGYFLGDGMSTPPAPSIVYTGAATGPDERVPGPATAAAGQGRAVQRQLGRRQQLHGGHEPVVGPERPDRDAAGERGRGGHARPGRRHPDRPVGGLPDRRQAPTGRTSTPRC